MQAAEGAIESRAARATTAARDSRRSAAAPPEGICGSGLVDLLAELAAARPDDAEGRVRRTARARSTIEPQRGITLLARGRLHARPGQGRQRVRPVDPAARAGHRPGATSTACTSPAASRPTSTSRNAIEIGFLAPVRPSASTRSATRRSAAPARCCSRRRRARGSSELVRAASSTSSSRPRPTSSSCSSTRASSSRCRHELTDRRHERATWMIRGPASRSSSSARTSTRRASLRLTAPLRRRGRPRGRRVRPTSTAAPRAADPGGGTRETAGRTTRGASSTSAIALRRPLDGGADAEVAEAYLRTPRAAPGRGRRRIPRRQRRRVLAQLAEQIAAMRWLVGLVQPWTACRSRSTRRTSRSSRRA